VSEQLAPDQEDQDDRPGRQKGIDDPRGAQQQPDKQKQRLSRRVLAVPAAVVDDMRKIEKFGGAGRTDREMTGFEDLGLEQVPDLVIDVRDPVQNLGGEQAAEQKHE